MNDEYVKRWHVCLIQDEQAATELARIAGQFAEEEEQPEHPTSSSKGDDLLAMMDDLWPCCVVSVRCSYTFIVSTLLPNSGWCQSLYLR